MLRKEDQRDGDPAGSRVKAAPAHPAPKGGEGGTSQILFGPTYRKRGKGGKGLSLELANTVFVSGRERGKEKEEVVSRSRSFPAQSVGRSVEGLKSMGERASGSFSLSGEYKRRREGNKKAAQTIYDGMWVHLVGEMFRGQRGDELHCKPLNYQLVGQISSECYDLSRGWILVQAVPRSAQLGSSWVILQSLLFVFFVQERLHFST